MAYPSANWTIMVYISADGVLANFAVESLKQLKRAAGNGVVVAAQVDTNGTIQAERYVFDKSGDLTSLAHSKPRPVYPPPRLGTPDPKNLTNFIDWASKMYPDNRHALFLWGHGPELLFDEDATPKAEGADGKRKNSGKPIRKYLTPSELKRALSETRLVKHKKIDIIGMDACSMSMAEIASELGEYVEFMVASQEDVPDTSFPYGEILSRLRDITSAEDASKIIPAVYLEAFRDYIASPSTGVRGITLSALNLAEMGCVTEPLRKLADALLELSSDPVARSEILKARKAAQGFVFGLFVDIVDLCQKLEASKIDSVNLRSACAEMREAIAGVVIANQAHKNQANKEVGGGRKIEAIDAAGLSIYLPYRVPDLTEELQELRAKGSREHPTKERSLRIQQLEQDFDVLQRFRKTGWNKFIQQGWSSILAKEARDGRLDLDEVYSAQQCAQNLGSLGQKDKPPVSLHERAA